MAFLKKLYRRFFPKTQVTNEGLIINDSLIPGRFINYEGRIWMFGEGYVVEVEKSNIRYYLSNGTLWWGIKSLLVDGEVLEEFKEMGNIVLKMERNEAMNRLFGARYASILPEEYSYTYQMWISGVLLEGHYFTRGFKGEVYEKKKREKEILVTKKKIKEYLKEISRLKGSHQKDLSLKPS